MNCIPESYQPSRDEAYMNPHQQLFFRQQLLHWRERLIRENHQSVQRIRNTQQDGGDLVDRSVHDKNRIFDFITKRRNEEMIQKINAALRRLANGSFGYCLESGEEIGLERLLAYPVATLSVDVQEFMEKRRPRQGSRNLIM